MYSSTWLRKPSPFPTWIENLESSWLRPRETQQFWPSVSEKVNPPAVK